MGGQSAHAPVKVRLVKGAYWDYNGTRPPRAGRSRCGERKYESGASYERVTRLFLKP